MKVKSCTLFKSGTNKQGKPYSMYNVELEGDNRRFTCFDEVFPGELQGYEIKQNGDYWNLVKVKKQAESGLINEIRVLQELVCMLGSKANLFENPVKAMEYARKQVEK